MKILDLIGIVVPTAHTTQQNFVIIGQDILSIS